uniref:Venom redulysin 10 n=1 Tax=Oncocephalus sp. TaxID=2944721 RepID=A0AB38ZEK8_9HEMI
MSKVWLLLLLVAAFQFVHAHPAQEYEVDEFASDEAEEYLNGEPQMSDEEETDYLEDGEDEERGMKRLRKIKPANVFKKAKDGVTKAGKELEQFGQKAKELAKKGAKMLKDLGVTITPLKCEGKECNSCIGFKPLGQSFCINFVISRTQNKNLYVIITIKLNGDALFTQKVKFGAVPKCLDAGDFFGKFCMKGIEAHAKSSKGKPHLHFCVICVSEKLSMGVKLCASYINKKMDLRVSPKLFPAAVSNDGEIVKVDEATGEEKVVEDEGEFEDLDF